MKENQNIEFKETWKDDYLKWICGFANAQGGRIYIGIDDNRDIVGVRNAKSLLEDIPNKVVTTLGIVVDVNLKNSDEAKEYIEIIVEPSNVPIAYHGQYHYRSGATKQELKGVALQQFILKKMGRSWDDMPNETAKISDIDDKAVRYFLNRAIEAQRIDPALKDEDTITVLQNLRLITDEGLLRNAAILVFGKDPLKYFPGVEFHIGRFGYDETDLIFQDVVEGNLIQMADKVMALLRSKYLISPIHYRGMQRIEQLEIPEDALREMIYNALVHKLYVGAPIQMWVFNDHIELWNEGRLPESMTIDSLKEKHSSHPRNLLVASVFYRAGFIETWGRGIGKINMAFERIHLERPVFKDSEGGLLVSFKRPTIQTDEKTTQTEKRTVQTDEKTTQTEKRTTQRITPVQQAIIDIMRQVPKASRKEITARLGNVTESGVKYNIKVLQQRGIIKRIGSDYGGHWKIS